METGITNHKAILLCIISLFFLFFFRESIADPSMYNVVSLGAYPSGTVDSTRAFLKAWGAACGSNAPANVYVPPGRFLLNQVRFNGPCRNNAVNFIIDGVLLAPSDFRVLGDADRWISFENVNGVSITGGIVDGQGASLWSCKSSGKNCPFGATTLTIINSNNVAITGLTSLDSQLYHIVIIGCQNVTLQAVEVRAPGDSPNTDGVHVQFSNRVAIFNSRISTGDDCVSIGPGTNNLFIQDIVCGPGHGVSIGSLGKSTEEDGVQNVTVTRATFMNTQNGARIKTWGRPSNGFVRGVLFQHATMVNVENPIIINQNYCIQSQPCPGEASGIKISDVTFLDIHGSSATEIAVKLDCSMKNPCTGIRLQDVVLSYENQVPRSSCAYAAGLATGQMKPSSCLLSNT